MMEEEFEVANRGNEAAEPMFDKEIKVLVNNVDNIVVYIIGTQVGAINAMLHARKNPSMYKEDTINPLLKGKLTDKSITVAGTVIDFDSILMYGPVSEEYNVAFLPVLRPRHGSFYYNYKLNKYHECFVGFLDIHKSWLSLYEKLGKPTHVLVYTKEVIS